MPEWKAKQWKKRKREKNLEKRMNELPSFLPCSLPLSPEQFVRIFSNNQGLHAKGDSERRKRKKGRVEDQERKSLEKCIGNGERGKNLMLINISAQLASF